MEKITKTNIKNIDYVLIFLAFACTVFGCVAISSAVKTYDGGFKFVLIQSVAAVMGIALAVVIACFNFENFSRYTKFIYIICILFLVSVLILGIVLKNYLIGSISVVLLVVFHAIRNNMMMTYIENNVYGNVEKNKKC